ncbi:PH domain-containing protein [Streptomyces sp. bgisy100]|uniref:PH domain-containing protein n=1 Tax=Streptomyces sp. bgisy100 TaxID=3413783 RepID=UPI003D75DD95
MTSPDNSSAPRPASQQGFADRVYRSPSALVGGVLLLVLALWFGGDAVIRGEGRTPWLALAGLLLVVPLVVAFTLRPAVFAGADRLRVRNPFRTVTLPWASVEGVRAGYSSEVLAGGRTYQLWAIPVSLRARKTAARRAARAASEDPYGRTSGTADVSDTAARRAPSDQAVDDLRELAERNAANESAQGGPQVRWALEVIVPSLVGAVLTAALFVIG